LNELLIFEKENQCNERSLGETMSILLRVSLRETNDGRSLDLYVQHGEIICLYEVESSVITDTAERSIFSHESAATYALHKEKQ
jgi:hypothetical protein